VIQVNTGMKENALQGEKWQRYLMLSVFLAFDILHGMRMCQSSVACPAIQCTLQTGRFREFDHKKSFLP